MIRRDATDPSSGQLVWLLITQSEHAGLAADFASAWRLDDISAQLRAELIWAVAHHDDGWEAWDQQPGLDADGRPLDFREMSVEQTNPIWARSIEEARKHGPLAGYLVASHFLALRQAGDSVAHPQAQRFAAKYESQAQADLQAARRQWGDMLSDRTVEALRRYISCFDVLSLSLCCCPSGATGRFEMPPGLGVTLQWRADDQVSLDPWPLRRDRLEVVVVGQTVPARAFRDAHEIKQATRPARLRWSVQPVS